MSPPATEVLVRLRGESLRGLDYLRRWAIVDLEPPLRCEVLTNLDAIEAALKARFE